MACKLLIISGPSGSGKGTLIRTLTNTLGNRIYFARSATTRPPRNDTDHYIYVSSEEFSDLLSSGAFAEHARYGTNFYGTLKSELNSDMTLLEIDVNGLRQLKANPEFSPFICSVFVLPPTALELYNRLKGRGTEDSETILSRLSIALEELDCAVEYDYILSHDSTEETSNTLIRILAGEDIDANYTPSDLKKFKFDLQQIVFDLRQHPKK